MAKYEKGSITALGLAYSKASRELKKQTGYTFKQAKAITNVIKRQEVLDKWRQIMLVQEGLVWEDERYYPNGKDIAVANLQALYSLVSNLHSPYKQESQDMFEQKTEIAKTFRYAIENTVHEKGIDYYLKEIDKRLPQIHNILSAIQSVAYNRVFGAGEGMDETEELDSMASEVLDLLTDV